MSRSIQVIKSGVVLREYPCDAYALNTMNGMPVILNKEDRSVACIPSSNTYDYIEINEIGD
jgi:hypothetical protein